MHERDLQSFSAFAYNQFIVRTRAAALTVRRFDLPRTVYDCIAPREGDQLTLKLRNLRVFVEGLHA
jgi:hypothetical protein